MLAAYGVDVLAPGVSLRRVWVLLNRLPPSARRPGEQWSVEAELLAGVVDYLAYLSWLTLRVNGAKGAPKPKPLARPKRRPVLTAGPPEGKQAVYAERRTADGAADGQRKTSTWVEAASVLAKVPHVEVRRDAASLRPA
jgi:hypothetical protein